MVFLQNTKLPQSISLLWTASHQNLAISVIIFNPLLCSNLCPVLYASSFFFLLPSEAGLQVFPNYMISNVVCKETRILSRTLRTPIIEGVSKPWCWHLLFFVFLVVRVLRVLLQFIGYREAFVLCYFYCRWFSLFSSFLLYWPRWCHGIWNNLWRYTTSLHGRSRVVLARPLISRLHASIGNPESFWQFFCLCNTRSLGLQTVLLYIMRAVIANFHAYGPCKCGEPLRVWESPVAKFLRYCIPFLFVLRFLHHCTAMISFGLHVEHLGYALYSVGFAFFDAELTQAEVYRQWHIGIRLLTTHLVTYIPP